MADEPRRSGRATKGQHTKKIDEPTPAASKTSKRGSKASKNVESEATPEEEGETIIRCVCGATEEVDDEERMMISCDNCTAWQHNECMGVTEDEDAIPEKYLCERCGPEHHKDLLAKIAKGEKPWEDVARAREQREEEEKARKKKGGRKGKGTKKARGGDIKSEISTPLKGTPEADNGDISMTDAPAVSLQSGSKSDVVPGKRKSRGEIEGNQPEGLETQRAKNRRVSESLVPGTKQDRPGSRISKDQSAVPARNGSKDPKTGAKTSGSPEKASEEGRRRIADWFARSLIDLIPKAISNGAYSLPEGQTAKEVASKLGTEIERAIFINHAGPRGDLKGKYQEQFRSMSANLKQNPALRDELLQKKLSPGDFSLMSTEQMAHAELQKQTAIMKEQVEKQHIIVQESGPRYRRTHKGDEIIEDSQDHSGANDTIFTGQAVQRRQSAISPVEERPTSPSATSPRSPGIELPAEFNRHYISGPDSPTQPKLPRIDTQTSLPTGEHATKSSASTFDVQNVWSKVQSASTDKSRPTIPVQSRPVYQPTQANNDPGHDPEVDELLRDDDLESPPYSPTDHDADPTVVWRGKVSMAKVADCPAVARYVAGGDISKRIPWSQLLPPVMTVEGRIQVDRASEYLCGLQWSNSTDVIVLALTPTNGTDGETEFAKLWEYFHSRQRYGVVGKNHLAAIRDIYIITVGSGAEKLPEFMEILQHNSVPTPRSEPMILITIVVRTVTPSAQGTPRSAGGAAGSPYSAGLSGGQPGSAMSPTGPVSFGSGSVHQTGFGSPSNPQASSQQTYPPTPDTSLAAQVLGPLVNTPAIKELLRQGAGALDQNQLLVVKMIMERAPATQNDLDLLGQMIVQHSAESGR